MLVTETFHGYIETTQDVLLIFEGCRRGLLPRICRRLQERERKMIRSGSIFVFDERESGIKRWTDGRIWSPSRILGNFLIYRELDKKVAGEKKMSISSASGCNDSRRSSSLDSTISVDRNKEKQLVGSLSDSYTFKEEGLVKKTMSIIVNGVSQHLISYYDPQEVVDQRLRAPSSVPELASLEISPELLVKQNFRIPPLVEPTFDQNDSALTGQITPPDSATHDRRMHPLRSMSLGSIRGHENNMQSMIRADSSLLYHPSYTNRAYEMDSNRSHSPNLQQPLSIHYPSSFTHMPSPASMTSSPSTPMLSPSRHSYQHQRHYSTSSASSNPPRFDPRNYSDLALDRHPLSSLHVSESYLPLPTPHHTNHHSNNKNNNNTNNNTNNDNNDNNNNNNNNSSSNDNNNNHNHSSNHNERFASPNLGQLLNPIHPLHNVAVNQNHNDTLLHSMANYGYPLTSASTPLRSYSNYTNNSLEGSTDGRANHNTGITRNNSHTNGMSERTVEDRQNRGNMCMNYYSRPSTNNNAYNHTMFASHPYQEQDALNNNGMDSLILK